MAPKFKLCVHLTISHKRDNVYKMRLYMLEEHNCLILIPEHVPK